MLVSPVLEAILALTAVYVGLGVVCSALGEWLSSWLRWRPKVLEMGLRALLRDARDHEGRPLIDRFYDAPLIRALSPPGSEGAQRGAAGPSYLPPRAFTETLLDLLKPPDWRGEPLTFNDFMRITERLPQGELKAALRTVSRDSGNDLGRVRRNLDAWFEGVMQRASGWYKRRMFRSTLAIAAVLCVVLGVDPLEIAAAVRDGARPLPPDARPTAPNRPIAPDLTGVAPPAATEAARHGPAVTPEPGESKRPITPVVAGDAPPTITAAALGRPAVTPGRAGLYAELVPVRIGAMPPRVTGDAARGTLSGQALCRAFQRFLGLLLSTIAVTMGAPFWFDLLNRFTNVRLCGPRPDDTASGAGV
jgi:hypothetical protein